MLEWWCYWKTVENDWNMASNRSNPAEGKIRWYTLMFLILSSDNWVNFFMFSIIQKQNDKRTAKNDWTAKDPQASFECTMCPWRGVGPNVPLWLITNMSCWEAVRCGDGSKPWYLVNPKIAGKWMFIPLKCIYRYWPIPMYPRNHNGLILETTQTCPSPGLKLWLWPHSWAQRQALTGHPALGPAAWPVWDLTSPLHRLVDVGGPPQELAIRISNSTCRKTPKKNPKNTHFLRTPPRKGMTFSEENKSIVKWWRRDCWRD